MKVGHWLTDTGGRRLTVVEAVAFLTPEENALLCPLCSITRQEECPHEEEE